MRNILIPINFSDYSKNATAFAIEIAKKLNSKVFLFNAVDIPRSKSTMFIDYSEELMTESKNSLLREKERLKESVQDISIDMICKIGDFEDLINEIIEEYFINLIVMGTQDQKEIVDYFIGTRSYNVIQNSAIPVFLIPEKAEYSHINSFIFAADLKRIDNRISIQPLIKLISAYKAKLDIIKVVQKDSTQSVQDLIEKIKLKNIFSNINVSFETIINDDIPDGIDTYLADNKSSVLVQLSRRNGFFDSLIKGSVTKDLTYSINAPILVLQDIG